jgi:hypothetical protein
MATETRPKRKSLADVRTALAQFLGTLSPAMSSEPQKPLFDATEVGKRVQEQAEQAENAQRAAQR